jgi:DNA-binding HxlR family transcriptional regulator
MRVAPANDTECPLTAALDLLGRVWMLETIRQLLEGPRHFVDLREATGCPSPSTFTRRLRVLESEGLVARNVISRTPPSVQYELTEMGLGLASALKEVAVWAEQWLVLPAGGNGSRPDPAQTSTSTRALESA